MGVGVVLLVPDTPCTDPGLVVLQVVNSGEALATSFALEGPNMSSLVCVDGLLGGGLEATICAVSPVFDVFMGNVLFPGSGRRGNDRATSRGRGRSRGRERGRGRSRDVGKGHGVLKDISGIVVFSSKSPFFILHLLDSLEKGQLLGGCRSRNVHCCRGRRLCRRSRDSS